MQTQLVLIAARLIDDPRADIDDLAVILDDTTKAMLSNFVTGHR